MFKCARIKHVLEEGMDVAYVKKFAQWRWRNLFDLMKAGGEAPFVARRVYDSSVQRQVFV